MNKKRALVAIVNFDGKILIGKKKTSSPKFLAGEWHIPGETAEAEETDEEALIRGIKEEAGIEIIVGRYIASHITPTSKREARWYECFADSDKIITGSDLEDARFVPREEVLKICSKKAYSLWPKEIIEYFG
jgi:NADH pyrophosphatase NudC (nudix superfamily)